MASDILSYNVFQDHHAGPRFISSFFLPAWSTSPSRGTRPARPGQLNGQRDELTSWNR